MQPIIKVENLTKRYSGLTALKGVSFEVNRGEIVGFLGPTGAGKSTTMRILSGFIPASAGSVMLAGYDVFGKDSLNVRNGTSVTCRKTIRCTWKCAWPNI